MENNKWLIASTKLNKRLRSAMASGYTNREEVALLELNADSDLGLQSFVHWSYPPEAHKSHCDDSLTPQWPGKMWAFPPRESANAKGWGLPPPQCDCWTSASNNCYPSQRGFFSRPSHLSAGVQNPLSTCLHSSPDERWVQDSQGHKSLTVSPCWIHFNWRAKGTKLGLRHLVDFLH